MKVFGASLISCATVLGSSMLFIEASTLTFFMNLPNCKKPFEVGFLNRQFSELVPLNRDSKSKCPLKWDIVWYTRSG